MNETKKTIHDIMEKCSVQGYNLVPEIDIEGHRLSIDVLSYIHLNKVETEEKIRKKIRWLLLEIAELAILEARQV